LNGDPGDVRSKDFEGFSIAASAVITPSGKIAFLGMPDLSSFTFERCRTDDSAKQFVRDTQFSVVSGVFSVTERDRQIR
jgi:hypothetical protein